MRNVYIVKKNPSSFSPRQRDCYRTFYKIFIQTQIVHYFVKVVIVQYTYNMVGKTLSHNKLIQKKKRREKSIVTERKFIILKNLFIVYNIHFNSCFFQVTLQNVLEMHQQYNTSRLFCALLQQLLK